MKLVDHRLTLGGRGNGFQVRNNHPHYYYYYYEVYFESMMRPLLSVPGRGRLSRTLKCHTAAPRSEKDDTSVPFGSAAVDQTFWTAGDRV
jgi:hypothetical protein